MKCVYLAKNKTKPKHDYMLTFAFTRSQAVTVLIRDINASDITENQMQVLLSFAMQDIDDSNKQGTMFPLIKVRYMY